MAVLKFPTASLSLGFIFGAVGQVNFPPRDGFFREGVSPYILPWPN
jgi:hypothetical protein